MDEKTLEYMGNRVRSGNILQARIKRLQNMIKVIDGEGFYVDALKVGSKAFGVRFVADEYTLTNISESHEVVAERKKEFNAVIGKALKEHFEEKIKELEEEFLKL